MFDVVKKAHHLITGRMSFTAREQDLVTLLVRAVKQEADKQRYSVGNNEEYDLQKIPTKFFFSTKELTSLLNVTPSALYHTLDDVTTSIMGKVAYIKNPEKNSFEKAVLVTRAKYENGTLMLGIDRDTAGTMLDYSQGFAEIDLRLLLSLRGGYEKRLLELISRFKNHRDYTCKLDDFYEMVGAHRDQFKDFTIFRRTVIEKPLQRLITQSNGVWTPKDDAKKGYELVKNGRNYSHIIFKMQWNEPTKKPKTKQSQLSSSTLSLDDAIKTYSELTKKVCLPSTAELNNLMSFMGQLMLEGFEFGPEFLILFKEAQDANGQLDSE
ncbi:replication initiation protein (plasmid) [Photobacterium leiognathi subsp. mandapamensis]|uniref:replication initiation protein n=1 Tax=Photobacterium leiognathi TaxID=553611 RepID=UPI003AF38715